MPAGKPKALFVHATDAPDLREDLGILRSAYEVRTFFFDAKQARSARGLARMWASQAAWLRRELPGAALVYGCFADYHLALPAALAPRASVPLAVRLGGYDANHLPELGYGVYDSRWRAPLARYVLRRADLLLPVAEALMRSETSYATWPEPRANGVRANVSGLATPHVAVPLGFRDPGALPAPPRARKILCVAHLGDARTIRIKGIDVLIEAARVLHEREVEAQVVVVGVEPFAEAMLAARGLPPNVELRPPVPHAELGAIYRRASVYAQPSRTEGMPNVVAEAMLCGCLPIVSPVGAMPEMVASVGIVIDRPDPATWADALARALDLAEARRHAVRAHVAATYSMDTRRHALLGALAEMTSNDER